VVLLAGLSPDAVYRRVTQAQQQHPTVSRDEGRRLIAAM
jgi:hypothetical protein